VGASGPPRIGDLAVVTVRPFNPPLTADDRRHHERRLVLSPAEPRVEHDPGLCGADATGRVGGYYPTVEQAADAAITLQLDVLIPCAHPRMGFWLAPLPAAPTTLPSARRRT
jgi:hypothetical protein